MPELLRTSVCLLGRLRGAGRLAPGFLGGAGEAETLQGLSITLRELSYAAGTRGYF